MGTPPEAVQVETIPPTDGDGRTTCTIRCSDPRNPRRYLDGQLYQLSVGVPAATEPRDHPFDAISVLAFDAYQVPERPTWLADIQPILAQYGNLYPIMSQRLVDLGDYASVVEHRELLRFAFGLDIADPNHMPVTRDLSAPKRAAILRWLESPELGDGRAAPVRRDVAPSRARTMRSALPGPPPPVAKPVSIEPKVEFVRGYLGLEEQPPDTGTGAKT
jgi:hypothetical protein